MIQKPPGIEDIFPDRSLKWNHILETAEKVFRNLNYREIIIPVMEYTEVFSRGLGDDTDIVTKEMFTFMDRGGRDLTLRPEGTAPVVRAYVENGEYNRLATCKLFYSGPMFRAERPQKGRLRQFNQFGGEFFGSSDPYYDFEIIYIMNTISQLLQINAYSIILNSIGCPECRGAYISELKKYFAGEKESLCDDCKIRLDKNPLRILDCKKESCINLKNEAPVITGFLCEGCGEHHRKLKAYLEKNRVEYTEDPCLVRGLDYYTRTTFEFVTDKLGGQNAFAAGGRYDNLVEQFGGKSTPAVGFAAGMERIFLITDDFKLKNSVDFFLIHSGGESLETVTGLVPLFTERNLSLDIDPEKTGFKPQLKKANRENARYCLIIGDDELKEGQFTVKNMESGKQESYSLDKIEDYLNNLSDINR
jgi:histidyl-tRNA synthetase